MWYSQLLSAAGRNEDALKTAQQAWDLDAVFPVVNHRLAIAWLWNDDNVRAAEQFARGATLGFINLRSPGYLIFLLRMQRFEEAQQIIETLYHDSGADPAWIKDHIVAISAGDPGSPTRQKRGDRRRDAYHQGGSSGSAQRSNHAPVDCVAAATSFSLSCHKRSTAAASSIIGLGVLGWRQ